MTTTHKAKRIATGTYNYRGWKVQNLQGEAGISKAIWHITAPGADLADDAADTLRDAKAMIDRWISQ